MRKVIFLAAAAALLTGQSGLAATAQAAQTPSDTTPYSPTQSAIVQPLDCHSTTGNMGCGAGWIWNGSKCVPC